MALTALIITGCGSGKNWDTYEKRVTLSSEEVTGDNTLRTTYTWDETTGEQIKEVQTLNGATVYEINDFGFDLGKGKYVSIRTWPDGRRQRLEQTVGYFGQNNREIKFEVFDIDEDGTVGLTPVEKRESEYTESGLPTKITHTGEYGNITLLRDNYNYDNYYLYHKFTYSESRYGSSPVTMTQQFSPRDNYTNYEITGDRNGDGTPETVETLSDYDMTGTSNDDITLTYTLTNYDNEGNPVVTRVTKKYRILTITVEY